MGASDISRALSGRQSTTALVDDNKPRKKPAPPSIPFLCEVRAIGWVCYTIPATKYSQQYRGWCHEDQLDEVVAMHKKRLRVLSGKKSHLYTTVKGGC